MSTFLINIIAKSNLAAVLAIDDAAIDKNNDKLAMNNDLLSINAALSKDTVSSSKKKAKAVVAEAKEIESHTQRLKRNIKEWFNLKSATEKVGFNIAGFSFRMGMWFVPAMILMATSMLPVIVGLLAIASAAVLAGGALGIFLALGALALSRRQNKSGGAGGYGGARRPYSSGSNTNTTIWTTLFEPIWKVLESPKLKGVMGNAKLFLEATIGGLAEGIGRFFSAIDPSTMAMLEIMFLNWLPAGLEKIAIWSSRIVNLIGKGSMVRLNNFIVWMANGIESISGWLANAGGWGEIDKLTGLLADVCSTLMDLGKSALPILSTVLAQIWPNPLKPIFEAVEAFCTAINDSKNLTEVLALTLQILLIFIAFKGALLIIGAIMNSEIIMLLIIIGTIYLLLQVLEWGLSNICTVALSLFTWLLWEFVGLFAKASNFLLGTNYDTKKYDDMTLKGALAGDYAPEMFKDWNSSNEADRAERRKFMGDTYKNVLEIFIKDPSGSVEDAIVKDVNGTTGNYDKINSDLSARRTVAW